MLLASIYAQPLSAQAIEDQTFTSTSTPNSGTVSGIDVDNIRILNFGFDFTEVPISAEVSQVAFTYDQINKSTGIVQLIDQNSTSIIDSATLNSPGSKTSLRFNSTVQGWINNPESNQGLVFKASGLENNDEVVFSNLSFEITYTVPDKEAPEAIYLFVDTKSDSSVEIKWRANEPVVVKVEYGKTIKSLSSQGFSSEYLDSDSLLIKGLTPGVTYHYKLTLKDTSGNITETEISNFQTSLGVQRVLGELQTIADPSVLAPPELLNLEPVVQSDEYHLDLAWSHSTTNDFDGYIIFRSTNNKTDYQEYHRTAADVSFFIDDSVEPEQTYYYFVRAYKDNLISEKSPEKGLFMPPLPDDVNEGSSTTTTNNIFSVTVLIIAAIAGFILVTVYGLSKVIKKVTSRKTKKMKSGYGLKNVLRDPEYYTADFEGNDISEDKFNH